MQPIFKNNNIILYYNSTMMLQLTVNITKINK